MQMPVAGRQPQHLYSGVHLLLLFWPEASSKKKVRSSVQHKTGEFSCMLILFHSSSGILFLSGLMGRRTVIRRTTTRRRMKIARTRRTKKRRRRRKTVVTRASLAQGTVAA